MLNKVILMGRITRDLELKTTPTGTPVLSFSLAVERSYAEKGKERQTDFIKCVAWRNTAEFISRFFAKGSMILIEGELQTRKYKDNDGKEHTVTEVIVSSSSFTGEKKSNGEAAPTYPAPATATAEPAAVAGADEDEEYPF